MQGKFVDTPAYLLVNTLCANGMHQRDIAIAIGVTRETICRIATGTYSGAQCVHKLYALYESSMKK